MAADPSSISLSDDDEPIIFAHLSESQRGGEKTPAPSPRHSANGSESENAKSLESNFIQKERPVTADFTSGPLSQQSVSSESEKTAESKRRKGRPPTRPELAGTELAGTKRGTKRACLGCSTHCSLV